MLKKMPILLALAICFIVIFGNYLPLCIKQAAYALSITLKSCIISSLPFIVFGLLFRAAVVMAARATWLVGVMLVGTAISTFTAVFLARFVGIFIYNSPISMSLAQKTAALVPLWNGDFKLPLDNTYVMMAALILGVTGALTIPEWADRVSRVLDAWVAKALSAVSFIIIPFIAGFIIQLQHEGAIGIIAKNYSVVFLVIAAAQYSYLFLIYFLLSGGSFRRVGKVLANMIPAAISGFTTMSSAASMPLLIQGIEKNTKHKQLARVVAPALVSIHWVGECFADVILAYAILKSYGMGQPSFGEYCLFAYNFFLLRFACVAVPGGGIIAVTPLLRQFFRFTGPMEGLITALYSLCDPILTVGNLLGDGAIAQVIDKLVTRFPRMVYSRGEISRMKELSNELQTLCEEKNSKTL